ncbi:hypothetical protein MPSEU_000076500 [Mayamaea pseudoterrestris]|nr:hypothetical protein MPSEU_000076500 [Mayamaea pseudoterrestris]
MMMYTERMTRVACAFTFMLIDICHAFLASRRHRLIHDHSFVALGMVRNIDYPEAIVIYGPELSLETNGLGDLLDECRETKTLVLAIGYSETAIQRYQATTTKSSCIMFHQETSPPPNPKDLWQAIHSIEIQPQPFGGSSGFAAAQRAEPPRFPLMSRVVVFGTTLHQTRAARATGCRVLSLTDNNLADAVIHDFENVWLQDVATPGSFWLNPPTPRDNDGNTVNVEELMQDYAATAALVEDEKVDGVKLSVAGADEGGDMDEDEMLAILADMAPL